MTSATAVLLDLYGRVQETVHEAVEGMDAAELSTRIGPGANTIAWLTWHLTRVQDDHVAEVAGREQVWSAQGWYEKFGLAFDRDATGYGQSVQEVGDVTDVSAELLLGYYDAVHAETLDYLGRLATADLEVVVDERWDPPVTLAARLISVASDDLQHAGQAAFIRGVLHRR